MRNFKILSSPHLAERRSRVAKGADALYADDG
jgi:hypothetical protein